MSEYFKEYYRQNKKRIAQKNKEWQKNNPEKTKEYQRICRERNIDQYRTRARQCYKTWISFEENRRHKKEYQKMWWKSKYEIMKEDRQELNEISRALEKGKAIINGYNVELKQDKGGMWFYYISQEKNLVYISDKFSSRMDAIKDLQYAV